jgi:hypothetical protein
MADTSVDPSNGPEYFGYFELDESHAPALAHVQSDGFKQYYVGIAAKAAAALPKAPGQLKYAHPDDLQSCAGEEGSFE